MWSIPSDNIYLNTWFIAILVGDIPFESESSLEDGPWVYVLRLVS